MQRIHLRAQMESSSFSLQSVDIPEALPAVCLLLSIENLFPPHPSGNSEEMVVKVGNAPPMHFPFPLGLFSCC